MEPIKARNLFYIWQWYIRAIQLNKNYYTKQCQIQGDRKYFLKTSVKVLGYVMHCTNILFSTISSVPHTYILLRSWQERGIDNKYLGWGSFQQYLASLQQILNISSWGLLELLMVFHMFTFICGINNWLVPKLTQVHIIIQVFENKWDEHFSQIIFLSLNSRRTCFAFKFPVGRGKFWKQVTISLLPIYVCLFHNWIK